MTKTEEIVIRSAIARLSGDTNTSEEVRAALADPRLRIWLDTWVIAPLALVLPDCDELNRLQVARGLSQPVKEEHAMDRDVAEEAVRQLMTGRQQ